MLEHAHLAGFNGTAECRGWTAGLSSLQERPQRMNPGKQTLKGLPKKAKTPQNHRRLIPSHAVSCGCGSERFVVCSLTRCLLRVVTLNLAPFNVIYAVLQFMDFYFSRTISFICSDHRWISLLQNFLKTRKTQKIKVTVMSPLNILYFMSWCVSFQCF